MLTKQQDDLVGAIRQTLAGDDRIKAAWLTGSLGRGHGDRWSDVDVLALVAGDRPEAVAASYVQDARTIATLVLATLLPSGRTVNFVTADWQRFDLSFVSEHDLHRLDAGSMIGMFSRTAHKLRLQASSPVQPPSGDRLQHLCKEFLRILGLACVVVGREEYIVALGGLGKLREMLIELMLMENGIGQAQRGGALHLNPLLTQKQRASLQALPPAEATRQSVITGHERVAALFLPRARRLALDAGVEWPTTFEIATQRHLRSTLGLEI